MLRNLFDHINASIEDRFINIINDITHSSKKYIELTSSFLELRNSILEYLPEDYQTLFYDFEILICERDSMKNLILYKQGIADGIKVRNSSYFNTKNKYDI